MDVLKAVQTYVVKMITEVPGMKVLLLDAHTVSDWLWSAPLQETRQRGWYVADNQTPIVSLVATQSELLAHEVYLTDRLDKLVTYLRARSAADPAQFRAGGAQPPLLHRVPLPELGRSGQG
jgi:hypothetical protein